MGYDEKEIADYVQSSDKGFTGSDDDLAQIDHGYAESAGDSHEGKKEAYYDLPENKFEGLLEYFDPRNTESVASLQKEIGAEPDGIFGPKSRQALAEYLMTEGRTIPEEQLERFDIGDKSRYAEHMSRDTRLEGDSERSIEPPVSYDNYLPEVVIEADRPPTRPTQAPPTRQPQAQPAEKNIIEELKRLP